MLGVTKGGAAMDIRQEGGALVLYKERTAIGTARRDGDALWVQIDPAWRRRGYGSYLLKEAAALPWRAGPQNAQLFHRPRCRRGEGGRRLAAKFGFVEQNGALVRRHTPDFSAVAFCHEFLAARLAPGGFFHRRYLAATGTTRRFCAAWPGREGRVLGAGHPAPRRAGHQRPGWPRRGWRTSAMPLCTTMRACGNSPAPATADCVVFNFGWLPGAPHGVHSAAEGSVAALRAALELLKPGGVLAAVLYSGAGHRRRRKNRPRWRFCARCRWRSTLCWNAALPTGPTPRRCPALC